MNNSNLQEQSGSSSVVWPVSRWYQSPRPGTPSSEKRPMTLSLNRMPSTKGGRALCSIIMSLLGWNAYHFSRVSLLLILAGTVFGILHCISLFACSSCWTTAATRPVPVIMLFILVQRWAFGARRNASNIVATGTTPFLNRTPSDISQTQYRVINTEPVHISRSGWNSDSEFGRSGLSQSVPNDQGVSQYGAIHSSYDKNRGEYFFNKDVKQNITHSHSHSSAGGLAETEEKPPENTQEELIGPNREFPLWFQDQYGMFVSFGIAFVVGQSLLTIGETQGERVLGEYAVAFTLVSHLCFALAALTGGVKPRYLRGLPILIVCATFFTLYHIFVFKEDVSKHTFVDLPALVFLLCDGVMMWRTAARIGMVQNPFDRRKRQQILAFIGSCLVFLSVMSHWLTEYGHVQSDGVFYAGLWLFWLGNLCVGVSVRPAQYT